ncbi:MAG TPA: FAD-dependent monooxygenase, partial [Anaerolineales bacterium]|nr:FAD-dependent monooxygenase [Anaerolineales bacterium]
MKKIIIIGGGIGGLCTAIALQQYGFEVKVYEKVRKLGEVGAGLTLWSNAIKVLRKLGVADAVISAGSKLERSQIRADNGETLFNARADEMEAKYGEPVIAIHRADLHEILINALKPGTLHLDMNCLRFEQDDEKVTIHFENGEAETADLLIGADGIH